MTTIEEKLEKCLDNQTKMLVNQTKMVGNLERNTKDLAHHIKRTNLLESKVQKVWYVALIALGAGLVVYGPKVFKLIGILL